MFDVFSQDVFICVFQTEAALDDCNIYTRN